MSKIKMFLATVATMLSLSLVPVIASASTNINYLTLDGSPNRTIQLGNTVSPNVTYTLTSGSEAECITVQLTDNSGNDIGVPPVKTDIADHVVPGQYNATLNALTTVGASEGTFGVKIKVYGVSGSGTDNGCDGTANDTMVFSNRLTLTASADNSGSVADNSTNPTSGSSNGTGSTSQTQFQLLQAQVSALVAAFSNFVSHGGTSGSTTTTTTTPTGVCAAFNAANVGTQPNVYSDANTALQGFLVSQHIRIDALTKGASWGFYGNQTTGAVGQFRSAHPECNA